MATVLPCKQALSHFPGIILKLSARSILAACENIRESQNEGKGIMNITDGALGDSGLPRRVLLVDDSVDAAEAMSMLLETLGHDVRVMHDGPSALAMVDEFAPEVVILDIGLPGMNGFEVARDLRTRAVTKSALLIALTGYGADSDRQKAHDAGFDHHLVKPVSFTAIETVIIDKFSRA
jgi:two-component system, OmpR family, response regulator